ncbi:MAG: M3 family metallopeptidase [Tannerella sp.]|jgi:peptidyl-dipeptidase Dcp|nr:M3 family metallopeptidase [Tannerella sp.]
MKQIAFILFTLCYIHMSYAANPLLRAYHTPHETFPFDRIKHEHYLPAVDEGIRQLEKEVEAIVQNPQPATFGNTIVALERSGMLLDRVTSAFFAVLGAEADDAMMDISQEISPKLSDCQNNIFLNETLFARVKAVYDQKASLNLSTEDAKLLQQTFDAFADNGANLTPEGKARFRQLSMELSRLNLAFDQNSLKDLNRYELLVTDEKDLAGLPESIREAAASEAQNKEKTGWLFTLSEPSYVPFMQYADNRSLREQMYRARLNIGNQNDEYDNKDNIKKIVNIRREIAQLTGYKNHAEYELKDKMAKNAGNVYRLLEQLLEAYKPVAINEYNAVQGFAAGLEKANITLMPWDWSYYSEKLKNIRFEVNDEMTRPYFELERVTKGIFGLATQLYGITFKENNQIPVYHPEVKTYEVFDEKGRFLSVLYTDFFPREGKQAGAWMNGIQPQYRDGKGGEHRPHVMIVMNFTRPVAGTKPSLLTYEEVNTFLHEFGHALHGMLTGVTYAGLSGTNVVQDFVELPSQIMENWLNEEPFLDQIATHYLTGEKIPSELVRNLVNASNFNTGYKCCRQVSFGLLDMAWHTLTEPFDGDVAEFEATARQRAVIFPAVSGALMSSNFGHIFSGGYAAGYYGYKWAEVLDADAFSVFKATGIFNRETAAAFREHILVKGGTEAPDVLYKRFRGQEPAIDALLIRNGIKK